MVHVFKVALGRTALASSHAVVVSGKSDVVLTTTEVASSGAGVVLSKP
jgi:hypothetical protein